MITHRASKSVYCTVPLSAVNGMSRLTKLTICKGAGTADSIRKFRMADSKSNRISKLRRSLVSRPTHHHVHRFYRATLCVARYLL